MTVSSSTASRAKQIAVVILTIVALVMTVRHSIIACLASRSPALVMKLASDNATALGAEYRAAASSGAISTSLQQEFAQRARRVLRNEPLSMVALSIAGFGADTAKNGASAKARALMNAAESLSRRNLLMQLWLIQDRVNQEDIAGALRHYDRALSIYPESAEMLYPTLTSAINSDLIREELVGYIHAKRPWMRSFLDHVVGNGNADAVLRLLERTDASDRPSNYTRPFEAALLRNMTAAQDFAQARALAARLSKGASSTWSALLPTRASSDPELRPITWTTSEDQAYQLGFDTDGTAILDVEPEGQGIAMYRVIFPAPGTYRLFQKQDLTAAEGIEAHWGFTCLGSRPINIASVPVTPKPSAETIIMVPAECPAVRVTLVVGGSDRTVRGSMRFQHLDLHLANMAAAS